MVKNMNGGNKAKKGGRKTFTNNKTILSTNEFEVYGVVVKMLGGKICEVKCQDNIVRLCHIRGSFSGKNKGANFIRPGLWVLIGLREWSTEKNHCDLICLYTDRDKEKILQTGELNNLQTEENRINQIDPDSDILIEKIDFDDI